MTPSELIDKRIKEFGDWRGERFSELRKIINENSEDIKEEWKWDTAVWTQNGLICAVSAFKDHVKLNLFKGAKLKDKNKLFNAGMDSKLHRAIDFSENDKLDKKAIQELIKEAISVNKSK